MKKYSSLILLNILLFVYSFSGVFSKLASNKKFLSVEFVLFYSVIIFLLMLYAIGWQQVIKNIKLTTAFSNKAITVVWGIVWGFLFFNEAITIGKIIGAILIILGVILFVRSDRGEENE